MNNSDFLFVKPSFFNGVARSIDVFGGFTEYNMSSDSQDADYRALVHDAQAVYGDLAGALHEFEKDPTT